jgi:hypothetical protein
VSDSAEFQKLIQPNRILWVSVHFLADTFWDNWNDLHDGYESGDSGSVYQQPRWETTCRATLRHKAAGVVQFSPEVVLQWQFVERIFTV